MAQIWRDIDGAHNNIIDTNTAFPLVFRWLYITFVGENEEWAEVRWRKANDATSTIRQRMSPDEVYSDPIRIERQNDTSDWTVSGGVLVPPVGGSKTFINNRVDFPIGTFSDGVWFFQVRMKSVGSEEISGWTTHKIEISEYYDRKIEYTSASGAVKAGAFRSEGQHGIRVVVMSAAGALTESSEQLFDAWDGSLYLHSGGAVNAVPTWINTSGGLRRTNEST